VQQLLPWHRQDLDPSTHPASWCWLTQPGQKAPCALSQSLPAPSQLEGSGEIRQGTKASRRPECGAWQGRGKRGEVLSFPNQAGSVCCVCDSGKEVCRMEALKLQTL
jgi:hypothetical protein